MTQENDNMINSKIWHVFNYHITSDIYINFSGNIMHIYILKIVPLSTPFELYQNLAHFINTQCVEKSVDKHYSKYSFNTCFIGFRVVFCSMVY